MFRHAIGGDDSRYSHPYPQGRHVSRLQGSPLSKSACLGRIALCHTTAIAATVLNFELQ